VVTGMACSAVFTSGISGRQSLKTLSGQRKRSIESMPRELR